MLPQVHYAHSLRGQPVECWQTLDDHIKETAELAESFGSPFAPGWGRLLGLWHDIGKYQAAFQRRIRSDPDAHLSERVDHSSVGALLAKEKRAALGSFAIAGHHGGLPNSEDLRSRLKQKESLLADARRDGMPLAIEGELVPEDPAWLRPPLDRASVSFCIRFVFSALVDADFLGTERFYAGGQERNLGRRASLVELKHRLDGHLQNKTAGARDTPMNQLRARVLDAARSGAASPQGAFSMTVPTGGGKTLSALAFALDHAIAHGLRRVIVVIPYTSIIEQTAQVYRAALGDDAVLEHHTNADQAKETRENRLASENWDAPLVVTTSVQFFESLYANRTSRCRKLHRIAKSVVVFDEAQTFNAGLLQPIKHALRELKDHYGVTTVLCTATQPKLLDDAREILPDPEREFAVVANRCEILMPETEAPVAWEELADELRSHERVLAIVHRRADAQKLAELTGHECFHLSARMCPAHRSSVLAEIKRRLQSFEGCRVVATQLVEAGVDVDFPEVYRAFAGADSMAQAAGRCNREGAGAGRLHVFFAPTQPPRGVLRTAAELTKAMWVEGVLDLRRAETFRTYFSRLYNLTDQDSSGIMPDERAQKFAEVAKNFKMVEESGQPVVAPYQGWQGPVEDVRNYGISRARMRPLQKFMVNLYPQEIAELNRLGALERIAETFWAIVPGYQPYSNRWGFGWRGADVNDPEGLIA